MIVIIFEKNKLLFKPSSISSILICRLQLEFSSKQHDLVYIVRKTLIINTSVERFTKNYKILKSVRNVIFTEFLIKMFHILP